MEMEMEGPTVTDVTFGRACVCVPTARVRTPTTFIRHQIGPRHN